MATQGHPANHSALLSVSEWERLAEDLGADASDPWAKFAPGSEEDQLCVRAAANLAR